MNRRLRVALGDLSYINDGNAHNLYVPINIGYIAAYAKEIWGREIDVRLYKDPDKLIRDAWDWRPDLVGLSLYYWNAELDRATINAVLRNTSQQAVIVMGGPSIDTDPETKAELLARYPGVRALIPNEGEDAFSQVIGWMLAGAQGPFPTFGAGLSTDLGFVPSPYLDGTLDEFLTGPYQPMIQTSRLCPYTCAFCVSGKNRGKLRAFPLEQVGAEIEYIGRRFADRPDHVLYVTDENFGIMERDIQVAEMLAAARKDYGYPQRIFYYNDKRFTHLSRRIHEVVGDMCHHGVTLSLQSENPETLKAIKRRNLTDDHIRDAIAWAHGLGLKVSTELIFGLPMETKESFFGLLDKCARLGFDAIQCYNLIIFDGIEMNRRGYREQHAVETRKRPIHAHAGDIGGQAVREYEEVAVRTAHFSPDDYRVVRALNVFFHAIFVLGLERDRVRELVAGGASLTGILLRAMGGWAQDEPWAERRKFMFDLTLAIDAELNEVETETPKLQPVFAGRLAREQWLGEALETVELVA